MTTSSTPRRASRLAAALGPIGTGTAPPTNRPATSGDPAAPAAPGNPPVRAPRHSGEGEGSGNKFTARLTPAAAVALARLHVQGLERLGRQVHKVRIVETLVTLAMDDATIRDALWRALGETPPED